MWPPSGFSISSSQTHTPPYPQHGLRLFFLCLCRPGLPLPQEPSCSLSPSKAEQSPSQKLGRCQSCARGLPSLRRKTTHTSLPPFYGICVYYGCVAHVYVPVDEATCVCRCTFTCVLMHLEVRSQHGVSSLPG